MMLTLTSVLAYDENWRHDVGDHVMANDRHITQPHSPGLLPSNSQPRTCVVTLSAYTSDGGRKHNGQGDDRVCQRRPPVPLR